MDATPAERAMAERPEPDAYFRETMGFWHGVPGFGALRERWEGFAGQDAGFAVLAALISEAEGKPEDALEKLRGLTSSDARWNEGRLLAILGREAEAVEALSALVLSAERPEMGAAALLALTELDCIRGDFPKALQRTTEAWEARTEEGFRLRILERHLSLLVEAGKEREFLEEQVKAAESTLDEPHARTAPRVCAVMADWFRADARLLGQRDKLAGIYLIQSGNCGPFNPTGRRSIDCGVLVPQPQELRRLAGESGVTPDQALTLAYQDSMEGSLPERPEAVPWLMSAVKSRPFGLLRTIFSRQNPTSLPASLARQLVGHAELGVVRDTLDLIVRAWAGEAGTHDAETLSGILAGAPQIRRLPSAFPRSRGQSRFAGWPAVDEFPSEEVIWNLQGKPWVDFYATSCARELLREGNSESPAVTGEGLRVWSEWRPDAPMEGAEHLMTWAWGQLKAMGEATPERAAAIAERMTDPGDRVLFAALCGRTELLTKWFQDGALATRVRTSALMRAGHVFYRIRQDKPATPDESRAVVTLTVEVAGRMGMTPRELMRTQHVFQQETSPELMAALARVPVEGGGVSLIGEDEALLELNRDALLRSVPHPLFGLGVCPSVERFRMLTGVLEKALESNNWPRRDPVSMALQLLLGGDAPFGYAERPSELEAALALFPTGHPLKHQLRRWAELQAADGITEIRRRRPAGQDDPVRKAQELKLLGQLAAEEQAFLPWHLVRVALDTEPVRKAVNLDILRARGPLTAGVFATGSVPPAPPPLPEQKPAPKVTPAMAAAHFLALIHDPTGRRELEPPGVLTAFANSPLPSVFHLAIRTMSAPEATETARLLMEVGDPLAARMAVILSARYGAEGSTGWLKKALAAFPDDSELLFASMSQMEQDEETRAAVFVRALSHLTGVGTAPYDSESLSWCGFYESSIPQAASAIQAIAEYVDRVRPSFLPRNWLLAMENVLNSSTEVLALTDIKSVVRAVIRCRAPYMGNTNIPDWRPFLNNLVRAGKENEAAEIAEDLLAQPLGSVAWPTDAAEVSPAWMGSSSLLPIGTESEGWLCLQLAGKADPAALADRLQAVAAAHPGDDHTAFAALLARGLVRPLTVADLTVLGSLSTTGRDRALAFASWLLPPDRLPAPLVVNAWETQAIQEFAIVWNGSRNFGHGNDYLDRLEAVGATEAVRRCLPALITATEKTGNLPEKDPDRLVDRVRRLGTREQMRDLKRALLARVLNLPETPYSYKELAKLTWHFMDEDKSNLPEKLVQRVTRDLDAAAAGPLSGPMMEDYRLLRLANAAANDVRWHPVLRKLLAAISPEEKLNISGWQRLDQLMETLDSGRLVPSTDLFLHHKEDGSLVLKWSFQGLLPLKPPTREQRYQTNKIEMLPWPSLAEQSAGKFDALFMVGDTDGAGERIVARQEKLTSSGELALTGLPLIGRLRVQLVQRESPNAINISLPLGFNLSPVMLDTSRPPVAPGPHPQGWTLLCEPAALNNTTGWQIEPSARPASPDTPNPLAGVALLVLDADGKVGGGAFLSHFQDFREPESEGFPGFLLYLNQLTRGFDTPNPDSNPASSVGEPRFLVLAMQDPPQGGVNTPAAQPLTARPPRITVKNWPIEAKTPADP